MSTTTTNYSFILPGVNDPTDQDLWGGFLNANWTSLDTILANIVPAFPIGSGMDYYGTTAPSEWIFPYGQDLSRTTYSELFAVLGTTYGAGDGSTTFTLPDKRGRASFGKDNMGGTSANRLTGQSGGIDGDTLGDVGGSETHALTAAENGPHTHTVTAGSDTTTSGVVPSLSNSVPDDSFTTNSSGSGNPHNNLPPGIVCNYIIYAGV